MSTLNKLNFQMSSLSSYIKELKSHFENTIGDANNEMQEKIDDFINQIEDAKRALEDADMKSNDLEEMVKDLESTIESMNAELEKLEKEGGDPEEIDDLKSTLDEYHKDLNDRQKSLDKTKSEFDKATSHAEEVRRNVYDKAKNIVETIYEFTSEKIANAQTSLEESNKTLGDFDSETKETEDKKSKTEDSMKADKEKFDAQVAEGEKSFKEEQSKAEAEVENVQSSYEKHMSDLKAKAEGASEEMVAELEAEMAERTKQHKAEIEKLEQSQQDDADKFKANQAEEAKQFKIGESKTEAEIAEFEKYMEELQYSKEAESTKLKEAQSEVEKFEKLCLDVLNPAYDWLNKEYNGAQSDLANAEKFRADLESSITSVKAEIQKAMSTHEETSAAIGGATEKLADLKKSVEEKDTEHSEASKKFEAQMAELKSKMEGASEEDLAEMEAAMEDMQTQRDEEVAKLKKESSDLATAIDYWSSNLSNYNDSFKEAQVTIDEKAKEEDEMKEELQSVLSDIKKIKTIIDSVEEPYDSVSDTYNEKYPPKEEKPIEIGMNLGNVIALHGGGGWGDGFMKEVNGALGTGGPDDGITMRALYPNGGYGETTFTWLPVVDKEAGETTTSKEIADESVDAIMEAINSPIFINEELPEQEPITLLGYSDGAAMIIAFLGRALERGLDISRIQRVIFVKGYVEGERHEGLDYSSAEFVPFNGIEAYIIAGQNDENFYSSTLAAQSYFETNELQVTEGGHEFELGNATNWLSKRVGPGERAEDLFAFNCNEYKDNEEGYNSLLAELQSATELVDKYAKAVENWFEERGITQDDLGPDVEGIEIFGLLKDAEMKAIQKKQSIEECLTNETFAKYSNMG
jgi:chromosome segregation ATPase